MSVEFTYVRRNVHQEAKSLLKLMELIEAKNLVQLYYLSHQNISNTPYFTINMLYKMNLLQFRLLGLTVHVLYNITV
jgi:hypothetical protein